MRDVGRFAKMAERSIGQTGDRFTWRISPKWVSIAPGAMALIVMPYGPISLHRALQKPITPALAAP